MKRSEEAAVNAYKQINGKLEEAARGAVDIERENRTLREKVDLLEDDKLRQTRETEEAFRQRHTTEMALAQLRTRCVPRDEYRQVVDEVEDLRRELNKKNIVEKKRDELEQKTKEMEEQSVEQRRQPRGGARGGPGGGGGVRKQSGRGREVGTSEAAAVVPFNGGFAGISSSTSVRGSFVVFSSLVTR
eukprot:GHVU01111649.1.p2 GENE.GHVU01111649.1~~GHVU01111649.1.p2  ORF type:complete len:188 (+),score=46.26 GHVU01111649.1:509-1072(+)